jgi:hypothetical protein
MEKKLQTWLKSSVQNVTKLVNYKENKTRQDKMLKENVSRK